ncbi:MAG: hypothetical protein LC792_06225 [Actinobacteria bacterium]|nr:hypothetical protein [Actinomycetota bacterium]
MTLATEYEFTLPKGYLDGDGNLHRTGVMRLATARDEIEPLRDPRVAQNDAYLTVAILARVVTELGTLAEVSTRTIEGLFAADMAYLQDLYGIVNFGDPETIAALEGDRSEPPAPTSEGPAEPEQAATPEPKRSPARRSSGGTTAGRRAG